MALTQQQIDIILDVNKKVQELEEAVKVLRYEAKSFKKRCIPNPKHEDDYTDEITWSTVVSIWNSRVGGLKAAIQAALDAIPEP